MKLVKRLILPMLITGSALSAPALAEAPVNLYAAGSLKAALGEVAKVYQQKSGQAVATQFGPSGLLRKEIEQHNQADLFASANLAHPDTLAAAGWGRSVVLFARNQLCAIAQPELAVSTDTLLPVMLQPQVRVGTSTPKADPSGDYAWELFRKADQQQTGAYQTLSDKALTLTGGPDSEPAPKGKNQYGWVMSEKRADLFITYCTNAVLAQQQVPQLQIIQVPQALSVGASYGMLVKQDAQPQAWDLAMFILSEQGQSILSRYGFVAPSLR
ncbi:molybdate ABC transporter substrate-binding protein [Ferrimonas balearica]|uniref:molybdate ABC transporter substrate-binding protein n=1 Tax=Ferrimonas balearica TaxID=44012 RepID=UPI001C94BB0B|nr:molybdate ABC transporter substrate-binding protein [Ferrimonas balearica]MBY6105489.1 molybdate ABC transporter substrate-binding protein [Ferrimonas balearica]